MPDILGNRKESFNATVFENSGQNKGIKMDH